MFDGGAVLRHDQVIRKRWIECAVSQKLFAAIKRFGRWRRDFDDDLWVDDHIAILIKKLDLSAYDQEIRIGVESFLRVTPSRQWPAADFHILCERLASR